MGQWKDRIHEVVHHIVQRTFRIAHDILEVLMHISDLWQDLQVHRDHSSSRGGTRMLVFDRSTAHT